MIFFFIETTITHNFVFYADICYVLVYTFHFIITRACFPVASSILLYEDKKCLLTMNNHLICTCMFDICHIDCHLSIVHVKIISFFHAMFWDFGPDRLPSFQSIKNKPVPCLHCLHWIFLIESVYIMVNDVWCYVILNFFLKKAC